MGSYFCNREFLGDKVMENISFLIELHSRFFKVVYPLFYLCKLCFQDVLLLMILFLITENSFSRSPLLVPAALGQIQNVTAEEGRNVTKECNVTAGTPPLNVSWKNVKTGQVTKGKLLTIINIRRNQSGEYRCIANNTCGNESTTMFIDVQCKIIHMGFFWYKFVMTRFRDDLFQPITCIEAHSHNNVACFVQLW